MNILITGTSSGLGSGLAVYYLQQGHVVYGISRKPNTKLDKNGNFRFLMQDLSEFEAVENRLPGFLDGVQVLHLVILNAGILNEIKDLKDTSLKEINKLMDVNVWANKILIDALFHEVPDIQQVVAVSSGASVSGARGWNAYALSKDALNMLIKLYSKEHPGTHFSALAPGLIDTGMQEYINNLVDDKRFPLIQRLKNARGTPEMPDPKRAAKIFAEAVSIMKHHKSGIFMDVRKLQ